MNKRLYLVTLCLLVSIFTETTFAADADEQDLNLIYGGEESVSIATGSLQPLNLAPAVTSVITAEQIARMGATDLDQVLETVPGVHASVSAVGYNPI